MSDTSPKDAVKAVAYQYRYLMKAGRENDAWSEWKNCDKHWFDGVNRQFSSEHQTRILYTAEALSQVRKQALLEAAEIYDKQPGREMFGTTIADELRELAAQEK